MTDEALIRMGFFFGTLGVMALWEILAPRRMLTVSKTVRWVNNLGLVFFNSFLSRLIFPAALIGMAAFADTQG
ncbi:MAG: sterol desaturase family protein, partial [Gammaproteobacteria bacterium]|nr:sterol desaturase family protein [Gammaproteobacteria bacterium]